MSHLSSIYSQSVTDGVWERSDHGPFGYSDGDEVESHIASIIAARTDCTVLSQELRSHIVDWPTRYHLSQQRANLLRPLRANLTGTVLEIGSGCGAITRYLGETASSVTALEGSRRRAHITRLRTRDQHNVEVVCDEFSAFQTEQRFDAVTLIGVLEYANLFVQGEHAALRMLSKAKESLNNNGCLIIAIENQLGLKYWAGAPEDHLGQAMLGLEDKYQTGGVRTYGKQGLSDLLKNAGFECIEFLYPFPDYKLPSCVLTDQAFSDPAFDPTPFLISTANHDPQLPADLAFSLERVWPVIHTNKLASDLSNSFLVIARAQGQLCASMDMSTIRTLAWHYSTQRLPQYCKETIFQKSVDGIGITVTRQTLSPEIYTIDHSSGISHRVEDGTPYAPLPLLSSVLIDIITRPGWTDQQLANFVLLYIAKLEQIGRIELIHERNVRWSHLLPGWLFDCVPQNIRLHPDGTSSAFDLEWQIEKELSLLQLVFRSLWHILGNLSLIGAHDSALRPSILDIISRTLGLLGKDLATDEAMSLVHTELHFQHLITGETFDFENVWQWLKTGNHRQQNVYQHLAEYQIHSANQSRLIDEQKTTLSEWHQHGNNLTQEIKNRDLALSDLEQHCHNLTQEISNRDLALSILQKKLEDEEHARHEIQLQAQQAAQLAQAQTTADSLRSSLALRQLANYLTKLNLISRSAKNLIRLERDFQLAIRQSANALSQQHARQSSRWLATARAWFRAKPVVVTLAHIHQSAQAEHLIAQSCGWQFPFEWRFCSGQNSTLQSVPAFANQLGINVNFFLETDTPAPDSAIWSNDLPSDSYLAFLRLVDAMDDGIAQDNYWPLPDAERLRLAYVALLCDPDLSMVYVGSREALQSTGLVLSNHSHPVIVIIRNSTYRDLAATISLCNPVLHAHQLKDELDLAQRTLGNRGLRLLEI